MTDGRVDLWVASPPELARDARWPALEALLTDEDRAKRDRFHFAKNRIEYAVTRVLARTALGAALGEAPEALVFERTPRGRPYLVPDRGISFNLSNHPTLVVCAVTSGAIVGADVEPLDRGPEILTVAPTVFSAEERRALDALEGEARELRAVSLWTSKEAYLKARGMGLAMPLTRITLGFAEPRSPTLTLEGEADDDPARWSLRITDVAGHRVAICAEGGVSDVRVRTLGPLPRI